VLDDFPSAVVWRASRVTGYTVSVRLAAMPAMTQMAKPLLAHWCPRAWGMLQGRIVQELK